jgi:hypothetical protein
MGLFSAIKGKAKPLMQIDTTLTESGQAADAKAAGDEFKKVTNSVQDVKTELSDFKTDLSQDYRIVEVNGVEVQEWINPPMLDDIEYRITERFMGKPVYLKKVSASFPSSNYPQWVKMYNTNPTAIDTVVDVRGGLKNLAYGFSNRSVTLPIEVGGAPNVLSIGINASATTVYLSTRGTLPEDPPEDTFTPYNEVWAVVRYTKSTD